MSKIVKEWGFSSKTANIDSKYDSFIHFTLKFNAKDYSISFFWEYSIQKITQKPFFLENSIPKLQFGFIQFNKTFIQLENRGIEHHYKGAIRFSIQLFNINQSTIFGQYFRGNLKVRSPVENGA